MHNGKYPRHTGSKPHIPPTNYHHRDTQKERYKKAYLSVYQKILKIFLEEKSGKWAISRKRTRHTKQKVYVEEQERGQKYGMKWQRALRMQTGRRHQTLRLRPKGGGELDCTLFSNKEDSQVLTWMGLIFNWQDLSFSSTMMNQPFE